MTGKDNQKNTIEIRGPAPLLQVFDMPTSISFYRDKLCFGIAGQSQSEMGDDCDWVLLRLNGLELMLNTAYEKHERPGYPDPLRISAHLDTAIFFGCPDVDRAYAFIRSKGIDVKKPVITGYGFKAIQLTDPDGYGLTFHWPVA